jgi:hypothetical protein
MPSVAPLRTADIAGLQGKRGNGSALPHNRRGKTLAVRLWHPLHILAGCDHNNKTATSRNARQEHPHNDGPEMSLAVTGRSSEIICPPGAQEFHRRCKSNSGCIWCDRPWNPRSATARSQSRATVLGIFGITVEQRQIFSEFTTYAALEPLPVAARFTDLSVSPALP